MLTNKSTMRNNITILAFSLLFAVHAQAEVSAELGVAYEYSDNIYKSSTDKIDATTPSADIALGYNKTLPSTNIALNYSGEYSDSSEDELQDSSYWIGRSTLSQQIFSKNILVNLSHTRQRYIINQDEVALESNTDEQDILAGQLQWSIPYSSRSTFVFGATQTQTTYQDSSSNDYKTNTGSIKWQHTLSEISQFELSYSNSENQFDNVDYTYTEQNLDAQLTRQYRLGSYSFNVGRVWIEIDDEDEIYSTPNNNYGFTIDAQIRQHLVSFNAAYALTNTANQIGTDNDLDFSDYQIYKQTNISLQYQYNTSNLRSLNTLRFYFIRDDEINSTDPDDQDQYGVYGETTYSITKKMSYGISLDCYELQPTNSDNRQFIEAKIGFDYNLTPSLYLQFTAALEKQRSDQSSINYEEQVYSTRLAYTY